MTHTECAPVTSIWLNTPVDALLVGFVALFYSYCRTGEPASHTGSIQDATESALNVFNHQKFRIVDGQRMMLTRSNFSTSYQYDHPFSESGSAYFHDAISIVEGPMVKHANPVFAQQWMVNARGDVFDHTASLLGH